MSPKNQSGIDIDLGNQCSRNAFSWAKKTFSNRPEGEGNPVLDLEGAFSNIMNFRGVQIGMSSDGIGTKIEIAERCRIYDTLGYDLIAMCADDLSASDGAYPAIMTTSFAEKPMFKDRAFPLPYVPLPM